MRRPDAMSRCSARPLHTVPLCHRQRRASADSLSAGSSAGRDRTPSAPLFNGSGPARLLSTGSVVICPGLLVGARLLLIFRAASQASGVEKSTTASPRHHKKLLGVKPPLYSI